MIEFVSTVVPRPEAPRLPHLPDTGGHRWRARAVISCVARDVYTSLELRKVEGTNLFELHSEIISADAVQRVRRVS